MCAELAERTTVVSSFARASCSRLPEDVSQPVSRVAEALNAVKHSGHGTRMGHDASSVELIVRLGPALSRTPLQEPVWALDKERLKLVAGVDDRCSSAPNHDSRYAAEFQRSAAPIERASRSASFHFMVLCPIACG